MDEHIVGVISDTHGLLRPEAVEALQGVELIIHAGDIDNPEIIKKLSEIAPVVAVRGNTDKGAWADELPETEVIEVEAATLYVLHNLNELNVSPAGIFNAVITGHTHQPLIEERRGVLYLNPGSAGPRRFKLPVTLALLYVRGPALDARLVELLA